MSSPIPATNSMFKKPDAYTPYAAGQKLYGFGASTAPTMGPVDKQGYQERDMRVQAQKNALLQRMKANQTGNYMSSEWLGTQP